MQSIQDRMMGEESEMDEDESDKERIQTVDGETSDKEGTLFLLMKTT